MQNRPSQVSNPGISSFDLAASIEGLGTLVADTRYTMVRHWDDDHSLPPEMFELVGLSWKAGPFRTSIIQHVYPCLDTRLEWFEHPNGALTIAGLKLACESAAEVPEEIARSADLAWLSSGKSSDSVGQMVTIRVRSLAGTARVLARNGVTATHHADSIVVGGNGDIRCAWKFVE